MTSVPKDNSVHPSPPLPEHSALLDLNKVLKKLILLSLQLQKGWYRPNYDLTIDIRAKTSSPTPLLYPKLPKTSMQVCPAQLQRVHPWSYEVEYLHGWMQGPCSHLPKMGNEFTVWRFLILTLMRVWFNTDLTGIVYSLFKSELQFSLFACHVFNDGRSVTL